MSFIDEKDLKKIVDFCISNKTCFSFEALTTVKNLSTGYATAGKTPFAVLINKSLFSHLLDPRLWLNNTEALHMLYKLCNDKPSTARLAAQIDDCLQKVPLVGDVVTDNVSSAEKVEQLTAENIRLSRRVTLLQKLYANQRAMNADPTDPNFENPLMISFAELLKYNGTTK